MRNVNAATSPVPRPSRRRGGETGVVTVVSLAVLLTSGCVVSEVTHTRNGETVTESVNEVPDSEDVDPCGLDESLLLDLSVDPADLARGSGSAPTCTWEKGPYSDPRLYYWVKGATSADPANDLIDLDNGLTAEIYYDSEGLARYILRTDDLTLDVSYSAALPLDPTAPQGVNAVMDGLLLLYGVAP